MKLQTTDPTIIISSDMAPYLKPGLIPETTKEIIFDRYFNIEIEPGWIPMGTETVEFGEKYNKQILPDIFPSSVTCIKFGKSFNNFLFGKMPENIKVVHIACRSYSYPECLENLQLEELHYAVTPRARKIPINTTHLYLFDPPNEYCRFLSKHCYGFSLYSTIKKIYISPEVLTGEIYMNNIMLNNKKEYIYWHSEHVTILDSTKKNYDLEKIEKENTEYIIQNYQNSSVNLYRMKINKKNLIEHLERERYYYSDQLVNAKKNHSDERELFIAILLFIFFIIIIFLFIRISC